MTPASAPALDPSSKPSPKPKPKPKPGKFSIGGAFALLFVYTAEMFPTTHRGVALGLCSTSARFGGVAAPAVLHIGRAVPALPWLLLSAVSFLASVWAAMELPETRGAPLPETLEDCKAKIRQAE